MIKIKVDEAAAFDMLSILELKINNSERDRLNYFDFLDNIRSELDLKPTIKILESDEYLQLLRANKEVFNFIERINMGVELDAGVVHNANMQRYYAKKKLQDTFFYSGLTEQKTIN